MQMPSEILCERCGQQARVLTQFIDNNELAGMIPEDDARRTNGFAVRIDCPQCGERDQAIAPPP
jgi:hypothetical protein